MKKEKHPNEALRYHRLLRGWSQTKVADEIGASNEMISNWERGQKKTSSFYQEKLCALFGMNAEELGFLLPIQEQQKTLLASVLDKNDRERGIEVSQPIREGMNYLQAVDDTQDSLIQLYGRNEEYISQREQWEWATWFGLQLAQILSIIRLWSKQTEDFTGEIQTLIDQEIKAMDEALEQFHVQDEQSMSRRQVLVAIAALPTMLASGLVTDIAVEDFLSQAAASIIACWHLLRGNGLTSVNEIIPKFAPALRTLALRPFRYQQSAARLATQTSILQAILAMHQLNVVAREAHCNNAIRYSDITKDHRLQAATRMYLGYTLSFCYWPRKPEKALPIFQQALHILGEEESLIRSDILMGMAEVYAQYKVEWQALHHIELARKHFPSYPEQDQSLSMLNVG